MKFLIQTFDGKVEHDFSHTLIESIKYNNWIYNTKDFEYILSDEINGNIGCIPIGSVDFVSEYLKIYWGIYIKPINIPEELLDKKYSGRNVFNGTEKDIIDKSFVKSMDKIKSYTKITDIAPPGNYQISDIIEIESEYRCFVYKNKLVGIQNYLGDFKIFPDINKIEEMISVYNGPIAYTLDIGITDKNQTVIIEVHDFFSVGFYGFSDLKIIPMMFNRWYQDRIMKKD